MPVIFAFAVTGLLVWQRKANKDYFTIAFAFLLIGFLGYLSCFRYETGADYGAYRNMYNKTGTLFTSPASEKEVTFEKGFVLVQKTIKTFSDDPVIMFFVIGLVTYSIIIYEIYRFKNLFFFCLFGFISRTYFYANLGVMRHGVAMAISLIAFRYLAYDKNPIRYILLVLLACSFHTSAALLLVFVCIPRNRNIHLFIFTASIIVGVINYNGTNLINLMGQVSIVFTRVSLYLNRMTKNANIFTLKTFYGHIIIAVYFLYYQKYNQNIDKRTNLLIWINLIYISITSVSHNFGEIFNRLTLYFELPFVFLLAEFVSVKSKIPKILRYGFSMLYFIGVFTNLYTNWDKTLHILNPYRTILERYF